MKLLIIDVDHHMVEMLTWWLRSLGYEVQYAFTGKQAKSKWLEQQPDLVIIDNALEDVDALALCHALQSEHDALVLMTAEGKDMHDEVRCLEGGADDYLHKPFAPSQLLARIHALSRRTRASVTKQSSLIEVGPLRFNSSLNEVSMHGKIARLTPTQGRLLKLLAINADHVCTLEQIVTHIWGFSEAGDASLIKSHIYHLRKRIELDPNHPCYILTVPGLGYMLVRHPQKESSTPLKNAAGQLSLISSRAAL